MIVKYNSIFAHSSPVRYTFVTKSKSVKLACVKHVTSVYSEPGSNSSILNKGCLYETFNILTQIYNNNNNLMVFTILLHNISRTII